jgi:hypothetical protein
MKNRNDLKKLIEKEIEKINKQIDLKIIKGLPYTQLGRKHAMLIKLLAEYR